MFVWFWAVLPPLIKFYHDQSIVQFYEKHDFSEIPTFVPKECSKTPKITQGHNPRQFMEKASPFCTEFRNTAAASKN